MTPSSPHYVLITGASHGIGKAIAKRFLEGGSHVFIASRHATDLARLCEQWQPLYPQQNIHFLACDLAEKEETHRLAEAVHATMPKLNVLVNNAGSYLPGNASDEPNGTMEAMMAVNFYSAYHLTRALLPTLLANAVAHIFNMSSVAGLQAYPGGGAYSISKYALKGFNDNLRAELKNKGIKVTGVFPGATMSRSWADAHHLRERIMEARDIAEMIFATTKLSPQAVVEDLVMRPLLGDL